ncbi:MAG: hypothetical protein IT290_10125, partial [Deltaproteobacteria bacterium]|nr:hypothetical protein [Deltaproteobacteria bacterium]
MRVDARSLIARVSQRLTLIRRINLACTLLPVIAAALLFLLLTDSIPAWANLIALGGLLLAAIALVSLARPYRRAATHTDAALLIDRSLASTERFLTLATADERADRAVLEELETQGNQLAASFSDSEHLAFALERPAKYSVAAACPILIAIAVLALTRQSVAPSARTGAASAAQELRELIDRAPTLPPSLASDLAELADTLDEKGLLDPETIRQIDETFLEAAALEQGELKPELSQEEQGAQNNQSAEPTPTKAPNKSSEDTREEQQPPPAEKPETGEKREDQQPPADQSAEPTPPPQSPEQLKEEAKPQPGSKGQQGNQPGNSGSEQGGKKEQAREGEGREEKQDDKTDETGVGEGKGKGKNGETKEQQGETQTGENSDGAKEGDAKNQSGDSQQENSKNDDAT